MPGIVTYYLSKPAQTPHGLTVQVNIGSRQISMDEFNRNPFYTETALRSDLRSLRRAGVQNLDVIIDSTGGSVGYANGIARALSGWRGKLRCLIDGRCASAATLVAFIPDMEVSITPFSSITIHKPRTEVYAHKKSGLWAFIATKQEAKSTELFKEIYMNRSGADAETAEQWLNGKTFSANQAVTVGLCDRVVTRAEWMKEGSSP